MEILKEIATKVGFTAFVVAIIIFVIFIGYLVKLFFKYRKEIKKTVDTWVEKENKRKELVKTVQSNQNQIIRLQNDIISLKDEIKQFKDNRVHDREQSFEIQKQLTASMTKLTDAINRIEEFNTTKERQLDNLIAAQKEMLAEKINEKYKYYLSIDGIPEDEYDEFVSLHAAYKSTGGNHHGDAKFEYCINHLKVIPVETKLVTISE